MKKLFVMTSFLFLAGLSSYGQKTKIVTDSLGVKHQAFKFENVTILANWKTGKSPLYYFLVRHDSLFAVLPEGWTRSTDKYTDIIDRKENQLVLAVWGVNPPSVRDWSKTDLVGREVYLCLVDDREYRIEGFF